MYKISRFYNYLIDYILPARCLSCAKMTATKEDFCLNCWKKRDFITKPYCNICGCRLDISILIICVVQNAFDINLAMTCLVA